VPSRFRLVTRLESPKRSSNSAFERDIVPYLGSAYSLARWLMKDATAAEDVVQDAFVRALGAFAGFRGENPRAWLLQIVRNAALDAIGRRRRDVSREVSGVNNEEDDRDPLSQIPDLSDNP
jgi:RNA polymerase sigma factor (sigma-70 family)